MSWCPDFEFRGGAQDYARELKEKSQNAQLILDTCAF